MIKVETFTVRDDIILPTRELENILINRENDGWTIISVAYGTDRTLDAGWMTYLITMRRD